MSAPKIKDLVLISYVIFVHWPSVSLALSGGRSWLLSLEGEKQLFSPLVDWEIIFLEWKVLGNLKGDLAASSDFFTNFLRGCFVYKNGNLGFYGGNVG